MDIDVPKLKTLLKKQRTKLSNVDSEKAAYIDWIMDSNKSQGDSSNTNKRNRKPSMEEKKDDDDVVSTRNTSNEKPEAKKRVVRPKRISKAAEEQNNKVDKDEEMADVGDAVVDPSLLSDVKFEDVQMNPKTKRALTQTLKLSSMTEIQSKTFAAAASGTDVLARARTGTGKTLAFLVPALERLLTNEDYKVGESVGILIVSPTRELATQIGDQAEKLLTHHNGLKCQVMYGGTKQGRDTNVLNKKLPTILVATPGRLLDHMENTKLSNGKKFGYDIMRDTHILVLDEADRLLEMGFRRDIQKIMNFLPKKEKRQTLLFSATVPSELKSIMAENMDSNFVEVDCIQDGGGKHTNDLVHQTYTILPTFESQIISVVRLVEQQMKSDPNYKIVVFFPTARMVGYYADFFNLGLKTEVIEIHSKKSQGYRNKASDKFRKAKRGILFTSDVSARGVDYPDVTHVIQIGIVESREQYIHRLGRTGRAGKVGEGILVLSPFEKKFINELTNIDISMNKDVTEMLSTPPEAKIEDAVNKALARVKSGDAQLTKSAEQSYAAFLGYYRGAMKRTSMRNNDDLVSTANTLAKAMGLKEQPGLTKRTIGKMGLKGTKGLRIISEQEFKAKR